MYDTGGVEYIDYHAAFSPHLLGHNHPVVNTAVEDSMGREESLFGSGTTTWEVELAELLCGIIPSVERVQLTNTGSEATAHAVRLSRSFTGRDHIVLTLGGYNGWHNDVCRSVMPTLDQIGPRVSPGEYPFLRLSAGIPDSVTDLVHIVNFNDLSSVEFVLETYPVACVMTEPVLQNIGVVSPEDGYLRGLSELCRRHGALLVFDEVKTGFRSALSGYQEVCGVMPDLSVFGKAVANGYPMGVIGGREDVMSCFHHSDPSRRTLIAGTYNAHPFSVAAGIATIRILKDGNERIYGHLEALTDRLIEGISKIFAGNGITATTCRNASAFCTYFCDSAPIDWHDILEHHDFELDRRYRASLIERGVYQFPLPCKQGSVSGAHTEEDVDRTLEVTREAVKNL